MKRIIVQLRELLTRAVPLRIGQVVWCNWIPDGNDLIARRWDKPITVEPRAFRIVGRTTATDRERGSHTHYALRECTESGPRELNATPASLRPPATFRTRAACVLQAQKEIADPELALRAHGLAANSNARS